MSESYEVQLRKIQNFVRFKNKFEPLNIGPIKTEAKKTWAMSRLIAERTDNLFSVMLRGQGSNLESSGSKPDVLPLHHPSFLL